jgi:hypothetical protein
MGGGSEYNSTRRFSKAAAAGYSTVGGASATADAVFTQQKEGKIHDSMRPQGIKLREARDSELHPKTTPIILGMDVTSSMGSLPVHLVATGLPKIMGKLIEAGCDPSLLFTAIGDHECDSSPKSPIQIGQFESGDDELDMWLQRTWIQGGGGGNAGESYLLAWYVAAYLTATDAWDKRKEKGFIFTIGDEPCLKSLPSTAVKELFGENLGEKDNYTAKELYAKASERWNVFHIEVRGVVDRAGWQDLAGQLFLCVDNIDNVADTIVKTVASYMKLTVPEESVTEKILAGKEVSTPPTTPML